MSGALWKRFVVGTWRFECSGDQHLARHVRFTTIKVKHHRIQQRERWKPAARIAEEAFPDARTALRTKEMCHWLLARSKTRSLEHRREMLFAKVFGHEIFFAVPRTKIATRVLRKQAVDRDCEAAAGPENAIALV